MNYFKCVLKSITRRSWMETLAILSPLILAGLYQIGMVELFNDSLYVENLAGTVTLLFAVIYTTYFLLDGLIIMQEEKTESIMKAYEIDNTDS